MRISAFTAARVNQPQFGKEQTPLRLRVSNDHRHGDRVVARAGLPPRQGMPDNRAFVVLSGDGAKTADLTTLSTMFRSFQEGGGLRPYGNACTIIDIGQD